MPRGIRRGEPQNPPVGTEVGSTTITRPIVPDELDSGYIPETSNDGMKRGPYHDTATDAPKRVTEPPRQPSPFVLTR